MYVKQQKRSSLEVSIVIKVSDCFIDGVLNGCTYFPSCEYMQYLRAPETVLSVTNTPPLPKTSVGFKGLSAVSTYKWKCEERFQQVLCAVNHLPSEISRWTALRITAWGGVKRTTQNRGKHCLFMLHMWKEYEGRTVCTRRTRRLKATFIFSVISLHTLSDAV